MLDCSIGKIDNAIVRKALSGYQFCELAVPVDSYTDSPVFSLTVDSVKKEYRIVGSEVYTRPGDKAMVRVSGILSGQEKWYDTIPMSVDSAEASDVLKGLDIAGGPQIPVSLLNLFLNKGQLAIVLANTSPKTAFVDFTEKKVKYYSDLYKQKPTQVQVPFRRIYGRAPIMGYIGWEQGVSGVFPDYTQSVMSFGQFTNIDRTTMENIMNNCNEIAKLFSDMQIFTWSAELEIGSTVLSSLTYDKKLIVASEEQWSVNDNMSTTYYCV